MTKLLTSNIGDARIVLVRAGGEAVQLSVDHVPDREEERIRIESQNPNPKLPLVSVAYTHACWQGRLHSGSGRGAPMLYMHVHVPYCITPLGKWSAFALCTSLFKHMRVSFICMLQVRYQGGTWRVGGLLALSRAFGDAYLKGSLQFEGVAAGSDGYSSGFGLIAEPYTTLTPLTGEEIKACFSAYVHACHAQLNDAVVTQCPCLNAIVAITMNPLRPCGMHMHMQATTSGW